ncbi:MAG TPA: hypothetical protein DCP31_28525 [Cyanobacteria bacterium UBA8543]|nr:hypothetical protein [Cyanobacteria bacterium UBA8543]
MPKVAVTTKQSFDFSEEDEDVGEVVFVVGVGDWLLCCVDTGAVVFLGGVFVGAVVFLGGVFVKTVGRD